METLGMREVYIERYRTIAQKEKIGRGGEGVVRKRSETDGKKDVVAAAETFVRYDHNSR